MSVAPNREKPEDLWIRRLVTLNGRIFAETGPISSPKHSILDSSYIAAHRQLYKENVEFVSTPIDTSHLRLTSASEFLPSNYEAPGEDHQVWSVVVQRDHDCHIQLLIPALVLIRAILPLGKYSDAPFIGRSPQELLLKLPDYAFARPIIRLTPRARTALSWVTRFPSAMKIWNDVKTNACHGRIAVSLPPLVIDAAMTGRFNGTTAFIQDMKIRSIKMTLPPQSDLSSSREVTIQYGGERIHSYYWSIPTPAHEVCLGIRAGHRVHRW